MQQDRTQQQINESELISRDLSWLQFNHRVLDQVSKPGRNVFDRMKFMAITASNADEFFMIRAGSLYNYLDYGKERIDYSGLRAIPFKKKLYEEVAKFNERQHGIFLTELLPEFKKYDFDIVRYEKLTIKEKERAERYYTKTIFPMLTPMVYDSYHTFPILNNSVLVFGVMSKSPGLKEKKKSSFIQIPQNLPRFFEFERKDKIVFIPVEEIVREHLKSLFKNVEIISASLFRVTRNGDFTLEESDDIEDNFLEEVRKGLKTRKTGRVVRLEVEEGFNRSLLKILLKKYGIEESNAMHVPKGSLIDFTGLREIIGHPEFASYQKVPRTPVKPISMREEVERDIFRILKNRDVLLHHPYNSITPVIDLVERAAEDPYVLSIKLTVYRLAKNSRITEALLNAAENGKHVSVLFEVKARFDEENNMREAKRLQKAGCFVVYGVGSLKTHTKLMLIVRKEKEKVTRYVHMSSGNYNEMTSKFYTDLGYLTTDETYANDVQEFFNVITGHSLQQDYERLITAPVGMRKKLISLINQERDNQLAGKPSGIVIKINSLQDKDTIYALYDASRAGVPIKLLIRGMCCLRPGRKGLSENIEVRSLVGEYLEHARVFYFHNAGDPKVYSGSADIMVRSFDRRIESLFEIHDELLKQQAICILSFNMRDNVNAYRMQEDGSYTPLAVPGQKPFNIHEEFYKLRKEDVLKAKLF
jgi:polyphosphate kinase